jgi:hypothetical protein
MPLADFNETIHHTPAHETIPKSSTLRVLWAEHLPSCRFRFGSWLTDSSLDYGQKLVGI